MKGKTDFSQDELCELLSSAEATQLGGSEEGEPSMNVETKKPICTWTAANSLILGFRDDGVVADLKTGPGITKTQIRIGNTPGVQSDDKTSGGFCQVGFDLNDHSNLIAGVSVLTGGQGKYDRCKVAKEMAAIVLSKVK
ncbi:uncharacterized protein DUF3558 [Labedaea rhizosphaerae]|uniref:Uncharacterized protein DUF3558 n=2 Tax=Labedaea rhizosphaerae TaxID=598644 RepID=A0A4R6SK34_LABRH|nr:uncharacterized protein DUF3558 [Labedaea rhizosphaerae]